MDSGYQRNLVKNPCGNDQFNHWEIIKNGGSMWRVEEMPGDCGHDFPDSSVLTYFVTSFDICLKEQTIDLVSEGYTEEILDSVQPKIEVQDWFSGRKDCGCNYELHVSLLNGNLEPVNEFKAEPVNLDPDNSDCSWRKVSHAFEDYGPGVRFVRIQHGGQDSKFWDGWFGVRVTNTSVVVHS
uniref:F-box only protein 2-like n=1 Tax=Erpetoichthys calabaricus TaxID=27687 RepID=A0A8C4RXN5_ERPCA